MSRATRGFDASAVDLDDAGLCPADVNRTRARCSSASARRCGLSHHDLLAPEAADASSEAPGRSRARRDCSMRSSTEARGRASTTASAQAPAAEDGELDGERAGTARTPGRAASGRAGSRSGSWRRSGSAAAPWTACRRAGMKTASATSDGEQRSISSAARGRTGRPASDDQLVVHRLLISFASVWPASRRQRPRAKSTTWIGVEQDQEVQEQRQVLDVVQVVLELLERVLHRRAVADTCTCAHPVMPGFTDRRSM